MADNNDIEVWLAPVEHAHIVIPLRVSLPTMSGHLLVDAVELQITPSGDVTTH